MLFKFYRRYTHGQWWNADRKWIDEDVPAGTEGGNEECDEHKDQQPDDKPEWILHSGNYTDTIH